MSMNWNINFSSFERYLYFIYENNSKMAKDNLLWIALLAAGGYFLYKSLNTSAMTSEQVARQLNDSNTGLPTGNGNTYIYTTSPTVAQSTIDPNAGQTIYNRTIIEGGKQYVPTFAVNYNPNNAGKNLTGGGKNSGYSISATPKAYTTLSSGFYNQAKKLGVLV